MKTKTITNAICPNCNFKFDPLMYKPASFASWYIIKCPNCCGNRIEIKEKTEFTVRICK